LTYGQAVLACPHSLRSRWKMVAVFLLFSVNLLILAVLQANLIE
jgi:hypothetical protein